jgi:hypothetical protein
MPSAASRKQGTGKGTFGVAKRLETTDKEK